MKKIWCWFITGLLVLSPTLIAYGANPKIVTVDGDTQLATYFEDVANHTFITDVCDIETQVQGIQAWGGTNYIRRGDFNGNGVLDIASLYGSWILIKTTDPEPFSSSNCLRSLAPAPVTNQWGGAQYTWVGDFNGDRKDDIASASGSSVYMAEGCQSYALPVELRPQRISEW